MKTKYFSLSIIFILASTSFLFSQSIKAGVGGGYAYISNNTYYTQEVESNYSSFTLGLRNCYVLNGKIKYEHQEIPIRFIGEMSLMSATNHVDYLGYYSPLQSSPAKMHLDATQTIYSIGFGVELPIVKSFIIVPYSSLNATLNYFSKTKILRTPEPDPLLNADRSIISNSIRAGLNIGLGLNYSLFEKLSLDISAKYNFMNLIGKRKSSLEEKEENFNTFTITANILYDL